MPFVPDQQQPRRSRFVPDARPDQFVGDDLLSADSMTQLEGGAPSTVTPTPQRSMLDRAGRYAGEYLGGIKQAAQAPATTQNPQSFAERLGNVPGIGPLYGAAEAATTVASGLLAPFAAFADPSNPEAAAARAIYEPRSAPGKAALGMIGAVAKPAIDIAEKTGADVALLPLAAEAQALRTVTKGRSDIKQLGTEAKRLREPLPVPETEALRQAKNVAYQRAEQAGVVIRPESTARAVRIFREVADKENLGRLPPKLSEALSILEERIQASRPLTLSEADKVRQIIGDSLKSMDAADRRLGKIIQTRYDNYLDTISPAETLAGNAPEAVAILKEARGLNRRMKNAETIDKIVRNAEIDASGKYTQAGLEHAYRSEFRKIAKNEKLMRTFTPEQRAAIEQVVKGGKITNALRNLGKFDPAKGGMGATLGGVMGGGAGAALGGIAGGLPGAGLGAVSGQAAMGTLAHLAARGATRRTKLNVDRAREALVGRGLPQQNRIASLAGQGADDADDILAAGAAFDAERASAAAAARGGYQVEELPGQEIVLETREPVRRAARSAVATRTEKTRTVAQIEDDMRALSARPPSTDPKVVEAEFARLFDELLVAQVREDKRRNRLEQLRRGTP